jgi:hypothetical protein
VKQQREVCHFFQGLLEALRDNLVQGVLISLIGRSHNPYEGRGVHQVVSEPVSYFR